jgi:GNAT superfamily N-acetyltransferase
VPLDVRARSEADLDACVEMLRRCHTADGYPARWPPDPRRFVGPPYEDGAWVATDDDRIVGHVALHDAAQDPACPLGEHASGLTSDRLAAVARLFSSPRCRRRGIGPSLLQIAADAAHAEGQRPFLNVALHLSDAVALYERSGWTNVGPLVITFADRTTLDLLVFLGPAP